MSIGNQQDFIERLRAVFPPNWFGDDAINFDALLAGHAQNLSFIYTMYAYVLLQTRIKTATDNNLDLISQDFFGASLPRRANESDTAFRTRILSQLFQERATRPGIYKMLLLLTGNAPDMFEPWRPADCGGYNIASSMGYGVAGRYGSADYPYQGFIIVYAHPGNGFSGLAGYNTFAMGYGSYGGLARGAWSDSSQANDTLTDQDIYAAVQAFKAFGTTVWVRIVRGEEPPAVSFLYDADGHPIFDSSGDFILV